MFDAVPVGGQSPVIFVDGRLSELNLSDLRGWTSSLVDGALGTNWSEVQMVVKRLGP